MGIIIKVPIVLSMQRSFMRFPYTGSWRFEKTDDHLHDDSSGKKNTDCQPVKSGLEKISSMVPFFLF